MKYDHAMSTRGQISIVLVSLGLLLAILPSREERLLKIQPKRLTNLLNDEKSSYSVDQLARFIVNEDSSVQLIDLRPADEFLKASIPGSINIPFSTFSERIPPAYSPDKNLKNILISSNEKEAGQAFIIARGMNYKNTWIMKGGLDEWHRTVLNATFSGDRISARVNALFEIRTRARNMFAEYNSFPDSLKHKYLASRQLTRKNLDGGCE